MLKRSCLLAALAITLASATALAAVPPGQLGYEGRPGNQGGWNQRGQKGYEGQPGNQSNATRNAGNSNGTSPGLRGYEGYPGNQGAHGGNR
jgi:opacity protein-like surface antigen